MTRSDPGLHPAALHPDPVADAALRARFETFVRQGAVHDGEARMAVRIARAMGEDDPDLVLAAALALAAVRRGHVFLDLAAADDAWAAEGPGRGDPLPWPADRSAWAARLARSPLSSHHPAPLVLEGSRLYLDRYHRYEVLAAARLQARLRAGARSDLDLARLDADLDLLFTGEDPGPQRAAARRALLHGFAVVTGGPGTGKTWTVRNLVLLAMAAAARAGDPQGPRIALAAPTGKAAARLTEALTRDLATLAAGPLPALFAGSGLTPEAAAERIARLDASTLHRLLGFSPNEPTRFRHRAGNPLPFDLVVVDEASMVDMALFAKLLDAVAPEATLVLLGDADQLASVLAGSVLGDLVGLAPADHEAVVRLTRVRRFEAGGGIARFARAAVAAGAGGPPSPPAGRGRQRGPGAGDGPGEAAVASLDGPDARRLDDRTDPADRSLPPEAGNAIVHGYRSYLEELRAGPGDPAHHARVLAAFDRFRVLVAHRSGERGLGRLNDECREVLVGAGLLPDAPGDDLVPGLPLMVLANDYGLRRFNGEIGIAVRRPGSAAGSLSVAFPGLSPGTVEYLSPSRLPSFEPAFALTVHKSQGSEFDTVLLVMPRRDSPLATRELVYTGATRARSRLLVLADPGVLGRAIERPIRRASGLGERVWGAVPG